jgi:hypothetical protein
MKSNAAVLTGDLIRSTDVAPAQAAAAMDCIAATAQLIDAPFVFSRFRGDGWQIYLEKAGLGLATALLITARLRARGGLESRIALGLGEAFFAKPTAPITAQDLASATGSAFTASGRALDLIPKGRRLTIDGAGVDRLHQRLIAMLDLRSQKWSREQAEVLEIALAPHTDTTQEGMAARRGITRQAVAARLRAADFVQMNGAAVDFYHQFGEGQTLND